MSLDQFVEDKINHFAKLITEAGDKRDEYALGELYFYITLRRTLSGKATTQDLGLLDAVNDVLQERGLIQAGEVFFKAARSGAATA